MASSDLRCYKSAFQNYDVCRRAVGAQYSFCFLLRSFPFFLVSCVKIKSGLFDWSCAATSKLTSSSPLFFLIFVCRLLPAFFHGHHSLRYLHLGVATDCFDLSKRSAGIVIHLLSPRQLRTLGQRSWPIIFLLWTVGLRHKCNVALIGQLGAQLQKYN